MNEELNKQLAALASRLGVSGEHRWGVLVKQAVIDGLTSLMTAIGCGVAAAAVLWFFVFARPKLKSNHGAKTSLFSDHRTGRIHGSRYSNGSSNRGGI
jgi:hypothetical protein